MTTWPSKPLKDVCTISPPKKEVKSLPETMPVSFMPMEDLGIGIKYSTPFHERPIGELIGSYTYFRENEVLLAKITPCFENGKLGIAKGLTNGVGFGSSEYIVFRPNDDVNSEYLYYFLARSSFRKLGANHMSGAVGHKRVAKEFIENTQIPLPPLAIQKAIVAKLDAAFASIDTAIAAAEKNAENAKQLFQSYLSDVFEKLKKHSQPKTLCDLTERITKGSSPKWQGISYTTEPGILFVTSENIGVNSLLLDKRKFVEEAFNQKDKKSILKKGDVLTNIVGASIGRTAVFELDDVANINQAVCLIRCKPELLDSYYLSYLLNSPEYVYILHDNEVDNARANLSLGFFSKLEIQLPSKSLQEQTVALIRKAEQEFELLSSIYEYKSNQLTALKQSLLQQAFNGQLVDA
jgi:type I restriction enzyme S subunit